MKKVLADEILEDCDICVDDISVKGLRTIYRDEESLPEIAVIFINICKV